MLKPYCFCLLAAGCPGFTPDVRAFLSRRMSGPYPGCPSYTTRGTTMVLYSGCDRAGCPGLPVTPDVRAPFRISGHRYPENVFMLGCAPDVRPPAGCPGLPVLPDVRAWPPDVRPLCSQLWFCFLFLISCQAGCPAPCPDVRPARSLRLQWPYSCSRYIYPFFSTGEG